MSPRMARWGEKTDANVSIENGIPIDPFEPPVSSHVSCSPREVSQSFRKVGSEESFDEVLAYVVDVGGESESPFEDLLICEYRD
jgi:hypothetical protein